MAWTDPIRKMIANQSPQSRYAIGRRFQLEGRLDEACEMFQGLLDAPADALEMNQIDLTEMLFYVGQCHAQAGRVELAESIWKRGLSYGVRPITGYLALSVGQILDQRGERAAASKMYEYAATAHTHVWGLDCRESTEFFEQLASLTANHPHETPKTAQDETDTTIDQ